MSAHLVAPGVSVVSPRGCRGLTTTSCDLSGRQALLLTSLTPRYFYDLARLLKRPAVTNDEEAHKQRPRASIRSVRRSPDRLQEHIVKTTGTPVGVFKWSPAGLFPRRSDLYPRPLQSSEHPLTNLLFVCL